MEAARPDTLAFLAPGLLHQLGNVLFTIQGNAQTAGFGGADTGRERGAILSAVERGSQSLRVLRYLLGDPLASPQQAGVLLVELADLLRVPVREGRHMLDLRHGARQTPVLVDGGDFSIAVIEAVRVLLSVLPNGLRGTVVLDLAELGERHATVRVVFQAPAGALPFPLPVVELLTRLDPAKLGLRSRPAVRAHGMGVELVFPGRGGALAAEA